MKNKKKNTIECQCGNCACGEKDFLSENPGRDVQRVGTAKFLEQNPFNIHGDVWAVIGKEGNLRVRLIPPYYAGGVSDGQLNGTDEMRFSLIGREVTHDAVCLHLSG